MSLYIGSFPSLSNLFLINLGLEWDSGFHVLYALSFVLLVSVFSANLGQET